MHLVMLYGCVYACRYTHICGLFFLQSYAESFDRSDCNIKSVQWYGLAKFGIFTTWCNMRQSFLVIRLR